MRWTAAVLATLVASLQLGLFAVAERQLQASLELSGPAADPTGLRWLWAVAWAAPWFVGAALFVGGYARRGAAVLITMSLLLVTTSLGNLTSAFTLPLLSVDEPVSVWFERVGGPAAWVLALAVGVVTWLARPRQDWRVEAPGPVGWYVAVAIFAWLPAAFQQVAFAPPGAPRRFVETDAAALSGLDAAGSVASAVIVAVALWAAPRLRPEVAGVVLLTYAVPTLLGDLGGVMRVVTEEFVIFTPSGLLGLIGVFGLIVTGAWWASRDAEASPVGEVQRLDHDASRSRRG